MELNVIIEQRVLGKRVTVVGAARSGMAAARLLGGLGADVFVSDSGVIAPDRREALENLRVEFEEGGHTGRATEADYIVTSPGIASGTPVLSSAREKVIPIYSELEVASWFCASPIIAITGSNGKTTTTSLIGWIMANSGRKTHVAGNIGIPFSDIVMSAGPEDAVVLEVSSFQLDYIKEFRPHISVLLNVTPDHLDRYGNEFERYAESKYRITLNQKAADVLIFNMDDAWLAARVEADRASDRPRKHGFTLTPNESASGFIQRGDLILNTHAKAEVLMHKDELPIRGQHNMYNSLAASIAGRLMEVGSDTVRNSLATFEGIAHRLEFVREVEGVRYVNDSKATNVNALWYALESFHEPIILIAGGRDKGNDYTSVQSLVMDRVRILISIGEGAEKIDRDLGPFAGTHIVVESLEDAVKYAANLAKAGETVLLSPACSSFDMFANYEERGEMFKRLISNL